MLGLKRRREQGRDIGSHELHQGRLVGNVAKTPALMYQGLVWLTLAAEAPGTSGGEPHA
jgi:hypothetical protein